MNRDLLVMIRQINLAQGLERLFIMNPLQVQLIEGCQQRQA